MSLAIQKAAETLVNRARDGEQNAMGMLQAIAQNRLAGNPKAGLAYDYARAYIKKNPPRKTPTFGVCNRCPSFEGLAEARNGAKYGRVISLFILDLGPSNTDSRVAAHVIARLRPVDRDALRRVLGSTPPSVRGRFNSGYRNTHRAGATAKKERLSEPEMKGLQLGYVMGLAKRIQDLSQEATPISHYSPIVGWELGE